MSKGRGDNLLHLATRTKGGREAWGRQHNKLKAKAEIGRERENPDWSARDWLEGGGGDSLGRGLVQQWMGVVVGQG